MVNAGNFSFTWTNQYHSYVFSKKVGFFFFISFHNLLTEHDFVFSYSQFLLSCLLI